MQTPEEAIKDIRDTIQFAMVVIIFFSGLMYSALKAAGVLDPQASLESVIWGVGIALHIVNYVAVGPIGHRIGSAWMRWIKASLVFGILAFIDPIIVGAVYSKDHLGALPTNAFFISFYVAFAMPLVTCALLFAGGYWAMFKDIFTVVKQFIVRRTSSVAERKVEGAQLKGGDNG